MKLTKLMIAGTVLAAQVTNAAITIVSELVDSGNNNGTNPIQFTGISVNAGDVVAIATAVNKNLSNTTFTLGTTAASGDLSPTTAISEDAVHGAHIHYVTVINPGAYNFTLNPGNTNTFTSNSSLYVLRADSGTITIGETTTQSDIGSPTDTTLDYSFTSNITAGDAVAIEALATQSGVITLTPDYTLAPSGGSSTGTGLGRRVTGYSNVVAGTTWSAAHSIAPVDDDFVGAGVTFVEAIPEPSSAFLLLSSLVIGLRRRR